MSKLQRIALYLSFLVGAAAHDPGVARAVPPGSAAIGCAVTEAGDELDADALCHPWQELYACKGYMTDIVDPWLARR